LAESEIDKFNQDIEEVIRETIDDEENNLENMREKTKKGIVVKSSKRCFS